MSPEDHARISWQNEGTAMPLPSIEELHARADRFRRKIRRRNLVEYTGGAIIIAFFAVLMVVLPLPAMRTGLLTAIVGVCVVLWQLHKRGAPLSPPEHGGQVPLLEFQRRELVRQRDALDSVFSWYLLPLVPGMLLVHSAPLIDGWLLGQMDGADSPVSGIALGMLIFGVVYWLNKRGARKLQGRISEIDALRAG